MSVDLTQKAAEALRESIKLSNEVIGVMKLIENGIQPTPGIIKAMRRYINSVSNFVDEIEGL